MISRKHSDQARRNLEKAREMRNVSSFSYNCLNCGASCSAPNCWMGRKFYCSNTCRYAHKRGENAANWRGGVDISKRKESHQSYVWRKIILANSGGLCAWCWRYGVKLHAHHLMRFAIFPELRYVPENGVALCRECHKSAHHPKLGRASSIQSLFPFNA
jgi:hypothetical protein